MKIEHTLDRLAKLKEQNSVKEANAAKLNKIKTELQEQNKTQNNPSAKVEISSKAKELGAIKKIAKAQGSDNSEKIAHIKNLIAQKKYDVSAEKIADKMVDEHLKNESV